MLGTALLHLFVRLFGWLCLVAGLVVVGVGGAGYLNARPYSNGELVTGKVVDNTPVLIETGVNHRPIVDYAVDGRTYQIAAAIAESEPFTVGTAVEVSYRAEDPSSGRVIAPGVNVMRRAAIAGAIAMAIGLAALRLPSAFPGQQKTAAGPEPEPGKETDEI